MQKKVEEKSKRNYEGKKDSYNDLGKAFQFIPLAHQAEIRERLKISATKMYFLFVKKKMFTVIYDYKIMLELLNFRYIPEIQLIITKSKALKPYLDTFKEITYKLEGEKEEEEKLEKEIRDKYNIIIPK